MMETNQPDILSELKGAIDRLPGTRADFARSVGIGQVYLSQILGGKRPLSRLPTETCVKISQLSGIPVERLIGSPPLAPRHDGEGQA